MNETALIRKDLPLSWSHPDHQDCGLVQAKGVLVTRGRDQKLDAAWRQYCHDNHIPFIRVRLAHKYGTVYGKLSPHQPLFTQTLYEALDCLYTTMPCGHVLIGQDYVLCTKVTIKHAELLDRLLLWTIIGSTHVERTCA